MGIIAAKWSWNSIATLMVIVAVAGVGFAALTNPDELRLTILLYTKVGLLLWATFRARYGLRRAAAWWFGFAAFGWAHIALNASIWSLRPAGHLADKASPYLCCYDLAGTIGVWLKQRMRRGMEPFQIAYTETASFWLTMMAALIGGWVSRSITLSHRSGQRG